MIKREEVEALLTESSGYEDMTFDVPGDTLASLCRAWLALDGAETAYVEPRNGMAVLHERTMPLAMIGQRVRIVKEAREE